VEGVSSSRNLRMCRCHDDRGPPKAHVALKHQSEIVVFQLISTYWIDFNNYVFELKGNVLEAWSSTEALQKRLMNVNNYIIIFEA
jgi:hypothetical protein